MADIGDVYSLLQKIADAIGANEGAGAGYGDYNGDGIADEYGTYGQGIGFSLYSEVLKIQNTLAQNLDAPVSSREPKLKTPGTGSYVIGRIVKDDTEVHSAIYNALVEARYCGSGEVVSSTRTNSEGKFVLFFTSDAPVDVTITSDSYQGVVLHGVVPQVYSGAY